MKKKLNNNNLNDFLVQTSDVRRRQQVLSHAVILIHNE